MGVGADSYMEYGQAGAVECRIDELVASPSACAGVGRAVELDNELGRYIRLAAQNEVGRFALDAAHKPPKLAPIGLARLEQVAVMHLREYIVLVAIQLHQRLKQAVLSV